MDQSGEYHIPADRNAVWRALNDADVLGRCINGCQSMQKFADNEYTAVVKAKVGPVSATFNANLVLTDIDPPTGYTLGISVKGGPAGFAKGSAQVGLTAEADTTLLRYSATANVGGRLAQVGSRLIGGAARKMADDFFKAFVLEMATRVEPKTPRSASCEPGM